VTEEFVQKHCSKRTAATQKDRLSPAVPAWPA
jgi:hypothetical protein